MAVVQISRIQIRRGQKNTSSGLPQLASGELAWAIDTQELYIGNGAVSEGAPYVGNTKIITEQDNLLELVGSYQFAKNNPAIQTGPNANEPVLQNLQDVIDQFVTASNFGVTGDGVTDDSDAIQRAVNQLFLNPAAYQAGVGATLDARTELMFGPGTFVITKTIYLPSYVHLTGAGAGHTVFSYQGDGLAFKFINANSAIGEYTTNNMTLTNQPKDAILRGFTISCASALASGLELNAVANSIFENISIVGSYPWDAQSYTIDSSRGQSGLILIGGLKDANNPTIPTADHNIFNNVTISNFAVCVRGDSNVAYNKFTNCNFTQSTYGIVLGFGAGSPLNNIITASSFRYINRQGIYLYDGLGNISSKNKFEDVGNDGGGYLNNVSSIIYFGARGNQSIGDSFDRSIILSVSEFGQPYKPEVEGIAYFANNEVQQTQLSSVPSTPIEAIRFPVADTGVYTISYKYKSDQEQYQFRKGTMQITVDITNNHFEFVDEFDVLSLDNANSTNDENLIFSGSIAGNTFVVRYKNSSTHGGTLTFVITALT